VTRTLPILLAVTLLLIGAVVAENALQQVAREDPLGRRLLYLPSAEMLRLTSLGNRGLVADLIYLWSIQYYSQYRPHERFLYLETVYNLITDLDPLYHDAYRVGALIMQLPTTDEAVHKEAVIRLFDKALRNIPGNYEIAEAAGWDLFIRYRDRAEGIRFFEAATAIPGAPHRLHRFLTRWREDQGAWSVDDALDYWMNVQEEAPSEYDRLVCDRQIYRLIASRDGELLNPVLSRWKSSRGRCPASWQELVDAGLLDEAPVDYFGQVYRIEPETCSAEALDAVRLE
jgi:tetratricopeptide (TPR) repeat protein